MCLDNLFTFFSACVAMEGDDDMPGHVKSSLMGVSLTIPVRLVRFCGMRSHHDCLPDRWQGFIHLLCQHLLLIDYQRTIGSWNLARHLLE